MSDDEFKVSRIKKGKVVTDPVKVPGQPPVSVVQQEAKPKEEEKKEEVPASTL